MSTLDNKHLSDAEYTIYENSPSPSELYFNDDINRISTVLPEKRGNGLHALSFLNTIEQDFYPDGFKKPSQSALLMAEHFYSLLPFPYRAADEIYPDGDKGVVFKWKLDNGKILMTIDGMKLYASLHLPAEERKSLAPSDFFDTAIARIPTALIEALPRI